MVRAASYGRSRAVIVGLGPLLALLLTATILPSAVHGAVVISEIANRGSSGACTSSNPKDWIELYNDGTEAVDLAASGYAIHDDQGLAVSGFSFANSAMTGVWTMEPDTFMLLCTRLEVADNIPDPLSPQFGIGGDDTITLVQMTADNSIEIVSSVGPLPNTTNGDTNSMVDVTFALNPETGDFEYTSTPTPGAPNVFTRLKTPEELLAEYRVQLQAQNDLGTAFFNMDTSGNPVSNAMDTIVDLHVTMDETDYQIIMENPLWEEYRDFTSARVVSDDQTLLTLISPGRIRTSGASALYMGACLGTPTLPFQLDFQSDKNASNTVFGVGKLQLITHVQDGSYMREWAYHRMLARFGLPHVRARKVRFFINNQLMGFYTLLEAADQDYVFQRNFPAFDPESYALFQVKSAGVGCGTYLTDEQLQARSNLNDNDKPPYMFQRGNHQPEVPVLGLDAHDKCKALYDEYLHNEVEADAVLGYVRYDKDCAEFLTKEDLVDQDLGTNNWDKEIKQFITDYLDGNNNMCEESCEGSGFPQEVDVENWLKTIAFYAVTMNSDSPLGKGSNYHLAQTDDGGKWKMVASDFHEATADSCAEEICNARMVYWSIARPTCTALENNPLVGPLLGDAALHKQYLGYAENFVNSVYGNSTFLQELQQHAEAIQDAVAQDVWSSDGQYYSYELSTSAANWEEQIPRFPLLPTMQARATEVKAQLLAIEDGTFARGPYVGANGQDNDPWEPCADWRADAPDTSKCPDGCESSGCYTATWTVPGFCDEVTGTCLHGYADEGCRGIVDGDQYSGMEDRANGKETFCRSARGVPVKTSECPGESSGARFGVTFLVTLVMVSWGILYFV